MRVVIALSLVLRAVTTRRVVPSLLVLKAVTTRRVVLYTPWVYFPGYMRGTYPGYTSLGIPPGLKEA